LNLPNSPYPLYEKHTEQIEIPPTLYVQGLWILVIAESFFEIHFNFLMHYDSKFGEDSFGHVARLYPERVYTMHLDIKRYNRNLLRKA